MKLTREQRQVLQYVADGEYLGAAHIDPLYHLEAKGLIETVKTGFISQVSLRITESGRAALKDQRK